MCSPYSHLTKKGGYYRDNRLFLLLLSPLVPVSLFVLYVCMY